MYFTKENKLSEPEIILLVLAICIIVGLIAIIGYTLIHNKHLKIVKEHSELYSEILKLNSSYNFYSNFSSAYNYFEACASKRKLDNLSLYDILISKIDSNFNFFTDLLSRVQQNKQNYELYCKEYNKLSSKINAEKIKGLKIKLKTFVNIENKLCKKMKLAPQLSISIQIKAGYTSPKGRNSYSKDRTFQYIEIVNAYYEYLKLKKQKQEYSYKVKIERAKMNDSLRYDILKRDGFRCQLCGASAKEGVKLHIDHIVPVSKGGKTVASNLRTLCYRCNMGKSDKIE